MTKKLFYLGLILVLLGIFGYSYTYSIDHRSAPSLSSYCTIDFQSSFDRKGQLEGATLSIVDYRYSDTRLIPRVTITADNDAWEIDAVTKQTPPDYSLANLQSNTALKNTNKLFLDLPPQLLPEIRQAAEVRVRFSYDNGTVIDLPLNEPDLAYWKDQLK